MEAKPWNTRHGRVRSKWSGEYGQVTAHVAKSVEITMDDGSVLLVTDEANAADFDWLGGEVF